MARRYSTVTAIITLEIEVDVTEDCYQESRDMPAEHSFEFRYKNVDDQVRQKVKDFLEETMEDWSEC